VEVDVFEGLADCWEGEIAFADVREAVVFAREAFEIEFDDTFAEGANPGGWVAVFPVVANVELNADKRGVEGVDVLGELIGALVLIALMVVAEMVPDVFDGNSDAEFGREREGLRDVFQRAVPDVIMSAVFTMAGHEWVSWRLLLRSLSAWARTSGEGSLWRIFQ